MTWTILFEAPKIWHSQLEEERDETRKQLEEVFEMAEQALDRGRYTLVLQPVECWMEVRLAKANLGGLGPSLHLHPSH